MLPPGPKIESTERSSLNGLSLSRDRLRGQIWTAVKIALESKLEHHRGFPAHEWFPGTRLPSLQAIAFPAGDCRDVRIDRVQHLVPSPRVMSAMSTLRQLCPSCNRMLELPSDANGRLAMCPACESTFIVGESSPSSPPDDTQPVDTSSSVPDSASSVSPDMNSQGTSSPSHPSDAAAPTAGSSPTSPPPSFSPAPRPNSNTGQPNTGQPNTGQPNTGQPNTGQPNTGPPHT
ncbi:MAG: hypothetical protein ACR2NZ_02465, partial [Rubripirellula sp.]